MRSPPLVLDVQHFCIHDGPGVRSVVFLKGCPLRCSWCQNPESYAADPELAFKAHHCVGCGACVEACPHGARGEPGLPDRDVCQRCFACAQACPSGALVRYGEERDVASLIDELQPEFDLMRDAGGGVTLSGGEPTLHAPFSGELTGALHDEGIHVAVETCGQFSRSRAEPLLAVVDLVLFDLKLADDDGAREHCRADATRIRDNLRALVRRPDGPRVWPRLPLIPGVTDAEPNLVAWAALLRELGLTGLTLVPHHALGATKRAWLGLEPAPERPSATSTHLEAARGVLDDAGIEAFSPGEEAW